MVRIKRGRPAYTMTTRRLQVLEHLSLLSASGEEVTLARLARRCGLYDYRAARRVLNDLREMNAI